MQLIIKIRLCTNSLTFDVSRLYRDIQNSPLLSLYRSARICVLLFIYFCVLVFENIRPRIFSVLLRLSFFLRLGFYLFIPFFCGLVYICADTDIFDPYLAI